MIRDAARQGLRTTVKVFTSFLVAVAAGLVLYSARQRLWLALKTGAVVFMVLLPVRLLLSAGQLADQLESLVWPALGLLCVWVVLWQASVRYERRKKRR